VTPALLLIGILLAASLLVVGLLAFAGTRGKRRYENVPPAMRPGYSDDELEKTVVERYMGWGLVFVAFFAVFVPVYWVAEQNRIQDAEAGQFTSSVAEGEDLYQANCAECHGSAALGGAAPHPYEEGETWPSPNLRNIVTRYEENENVDDVRDLLTTTLERGRPGTPMPAYGRAYQGPFTDTEIRAVVDWILVNQDEPDEAEETAQAATDLDGEALYTANCAMCHGPEGEGRVGPTLIGTLERHGEDGVKGILRNGIVVGTGTTMPAFQNGWFYTEGRLDDDQLSAVVDHLRALQPDELDEEFERYPTPGVERGPGGAPHDDGDDADDDEQTAGADTAGGS